jgi:hypothetical protein
MEIWGNQYRPEGEALHNRGKEEKDERQEGSYFPI